MRSLLLLAFATVAFAGDPQPDPATAHLPPDAVFVVRVASAERLDAIGRDLPVLAQLTESRRPLGDSILGTIDGATLMDRSKPVYFAVGLDGEKTTLVAAKAGVTAEKAEALGFRLLPDGWIRASSGAGASASAPVHLLPGDVSLSFKVSSLLEKYRAKVDEASANLDKLDELAEEVEEHGITVPPAALRFLKILARKAIRAVADLDGIHYALTWRDGKLESEGWVQTLERSALRKWLEARKGTKPNDLIGLLPDRAFCMVESAGTASALDADVAALLDEAVGEGGRSLLLLLSPSCVLHEQLTGQAAGVVTVQGMSTGVLAIHEVKPGAPIADAIAKLDTKKINEISGGLLEARIERGFSKSGDTPIHRLTFRCEIPQAAILVGQMTTCFAVEGGYLLVAQSERAEMDLAALILKVRSPEKKPHPHMAAMERLMPDRQEGLSVNIGTLKPAFGMLAMFVPEAAQIVNAVPDELWFSTALAVRDGNVHVRGDWPVKELLDFVARVKAVVDQR